MELTINPQSHDLTKYIDIRYHFVREAIGNNLATLDYVPTAEMTADIMTKSLPRENSRSARRQDTLRARAMSCTIRPNLYAIMAPAAPEVMQRKVAP